MDRWILSAHGMELGEYQGETLEDAADSYCREAGYPSRINAAAQLGYDPAGAVTGERAPLQGPDPVPPLLNGFAQI